MVNNSPTSEGDMQDIWFHSLRRKWEPSPAFLLAKLHGQGTPVGYSRGSCKRLDMTGHSYAHITT